MEKYIKELKEELELAETISKFKVGDWIVSGNTKPVKIIELDGGEATLWSANGEVDDFCGFFITDRLASLYEISSTLIESFKSDIDIYNAIYSYRPDELSVDGNVVYSNGRWLYNNFNVGDWLIGGELGLSKILEFIDKYSYVGLLPDGQKFPMEITPDDKIATVEEILNYYKYETFEKRAGEQ